MRGARTLIMPPRARHSHDGPLTLSETLRTVDRPTSDVACRDSGRLAGSGNIIARGVALQSRLGSSRRRSLPVLRLHEYAPDPGGESLGPVAGEHPLLFRRERMEVRQDVWFPGLAGCHRVRLSCPDHPGGPARPLRARPGRHHCRMTRGRFAPRTPRQFPRSVATSPNSSVAWVGTCRESSSSSQHRISLASSSVLTGTPARFRVQRLGEFVERPGAWERRRPGGSSALPGVLCMTGSVEPGP